MKSLKKRLKIIKDWKEPYWVKAINTLNQTDLNKYLNKWLLSNGLDSEQQRNLKCTGLNNYENFEISKITGLKTNNFWLNCEIDDNQHYILSSGFKDWRHICLTKTTKLRFDETNKIRPSVKKLIEEIIESDNENYEQIKKHLLILQSLPRCKKYLDKNWSNYIKVNPDELVKPEPDKKELSLLQLWPGGKEWGGWGK